MTFLFYARSVTASCSVDALNPNWATSWNRTYSVRPPCSANSARIRFFAAINSAALRQYRWRRAWSDGDRSRRKSALCRKWALWRASCCLGLFFRSFSGHRPEFFLTGRKKLSQFGHNVWKGRLVNNTVTASFNAIMRKLTEMSQRKKKLSLLHPHQRCCLLPVV